MWIYDKYYMWIYNKSIYFTIIKIHAQDITFWTTLIFIYECNKDYCKGLFHCKYSHTLVFLFLKLNIFCFIYITQFLLLSLLKSRNIHIEEFIIMRIHKWHILIFLKFPFSIRNSVLLKHLNAIIYRPQDILNLILHHF